MTLLALLVGLIQVDIVAAQEAEQLRPGVVKITAKAQGVTKSRDRIHCPARERCGLYRDSSPCRSRGCPPKVEFFTKRNVPVPAEVLGLEGGD